MRDKYVTNILYPIPRPASLRLSQISFLLRPLAIASFIFGINCRISDIFFVGCFCSMADSNAEVSIGFIALPMYGYVEGIIAAVEPEVNCRMAAIVSMSNK